MQQALRPARSRRYGRRAHDARDGNLTRSAQIYRERCLSVVPSMASSANWRPDPERPRTAEYPVAALVDLYTGAECALPAGRDDGTAFRLFAGTDGSSIVLSRARVAEHRYSLHVSRGRVAVYAEPTSDRDTTVNGVALLPGLGLDLAQGAIIRVADTAVIAVGRPIDPTVEVAVRTIDELMLAHLRIHGSMRAAARALGIAKSTFNDRVRRARARRSALRYPGSV